MKRTCEATLEKAALSLSSQILIGLILGLIVGLFFGAWVEPLGVLGDAFVLLLQMTVLPYLAVSLMVGLGAGVGG